MDSGINSAINIDAVKYLNGLRDSRKDFSNKVKIGGLIGCKYDCYLPEKGLSADESEEFHAWQIEQLVRGGVDFLLAETLPNVAEAVGIARAMGKSGKPYFISFVISREGKVLDGSSLAGAIIQVDSGTSHNPIGFMVNCAHPSFLVPDQQPPEVFSRLLGFNANASSLDLCDLDGARDLMVDSASDWGNKMLLLNRKYGVKILGGCCGTGVEPLNYITSF
jgi:homocysteine S-methyltransferase